MTSISFWQLMSLSYRSRSMLKSPVKSISLFLCLFSPWRSVSKRSMKFSGEREGDLYVLHKIIVFLMFLHRLSLTSINSPSSSDVNSYMFFGTNFSYSSIPQTFLLIYVARPPPLFVFRVGFCNMGG